MRWTWVPNIILSSLWAIISRRACVTCLCLTWPSLHYPVCTSRTCCLCNSISRERAKIPSRTRKLNRCRGNWAFMTNKSGSACNAWIWLWGRILTGWANLNYFFINRLIACYSFLAHYGAFSRERACWTISTWVLTTYRKLSCLTWLNPSRFVLEASENRTTIWLPL